MISQFFSKIRITSVSCHCLRFKTKICQTVAGISMTCQFHEFFNLILAGFCNWAKLCDAARAWAAASRIASDSYQLAGRQFLQVRATYMAQMHATTAHFTVLLSIHFWQKFWHFCQIFLPITKLHIYGNWQSILVHYFVQKPKIFLELDFFSLKSI